MRCSRIVLLVLGMAACARPALHPSAAPAASYQFRGDPTPITSRRWHEDGLRFPQLRFFHGYDALILAPNAGLATPPRVALRDRQAIFGGRLGSAEVLAPAAAVGKYVIFLPPLDADGDVVARPAAWQPHLAPYAAAAAIGVASLDETPRSLADALLRGDWIEATIDASPLPPVILLPLGPALAPFNRARTLPVIGQVSDLFSVTATWVPRRTER
jgi:hypothetical protein